MIVSRKRACFAWGLFKIQLPHMLWLLSTDSALGPEQHLLSLNKAKQNYQNMLIRGSPAIYVTYIYIWKHTHIYMFSLQR